MKRAVYFWIASSLTLLAMTKGCFDFPPRYARGHNDKHEGKPKYDS